MRRIALGWLVAGVLVGLASPALIAQDEEEISPVYIANAPLAEEALGTLDAMLARGGEDEAVRLIQRVLSEHGNDLIGSDLPGLFISVRSRVHAHVLQRPALLGAYRSRQTPRASSLLASGEWAEVASDYWLTEPGLEASLREAQSLIERAHFSAGLRVLGDLEQHPDASTLASDAAALVRMGARHVADPDAASLATRWAALAGEPPRAIETAPQPKIVGREPVSALDWVLDAETRDPFRTAGIVPRALHRAELTELDASPPEQALRGGVSRAELPWVLPVLTKQSVLTNDGMTLSSFDRFTLRPKWRVRAPIESGEELNTASERGRIGRGLEDSCSVTVDGDDVFAALGLPRAMTSVQARRVVRVDARTGRVIWSVGLDDLASELSESAPRGPIVVLGDTVVVGARKNLRTRRLVSLTLIGLDRATGALKWIRPVGSAGSLPFQQMTHLAEGGASRAGVVYWSDKLGLVTAIEAGSGHVRWVRELQAPGVYARGARTPYTTSLPIPTEVGVFVLSPNQEHILLLDHRTGALIAERIGEPVGPNESPTYLLRIGDRIGAMGRGSVAFWDIEEFATSPTRVIALSGENEPRGRAVDAGGLLAVSGVGGISLIDPARPSMIETIDLEGSGNIVLDDGQAIVVNESEVFSFLSWSAASAMLSQRVSEGDLDAALALAELANRSGRADQVLPAIDDAVMLAERTSGSDASAVRERVFNVIRVLSDPVADGAAPVPTPDRGELLKRLQRLARTNEQRVAHRMALGAWHDASGSPESAAQAFQGILLDEGLRRAVWVGGGLSVRAELAASRQLISLVERFGARTVAPYERIAQQEAVSLEVASDPEQWITLAKRYPACSTAPGAWSRAASLFAGSGRAMLGERAARSGLRAAESAASRAQPADRTVIDELAGALVASLRDQGRGEEIPGVIIEISGAHGPVTPMLNAEPVEYSGRVAIGRLPVIGDRFVLESEPVLIPGSPVATMIEGSPDTVLMHAPQLGELAAYRVQDGVLTELWRTDGHGSAAPSLIHAQESAWVLVWPEETMSTTRAPLAQRIDPATGAVRWTVEIAKVFSRVDRREDPLLERDRQFISPAEGTVQPEQLLAAADRRTLIVADRAGAVMGVDIPTGRVLWSRALEATRVYGLDMGGGLIGVCGALPLVGEAVDGRSAMRGVAEAIDSRTGEAVQRLDDLGTETRWVRVAPDGTVIVGAGTQIVAMDTLDGRIEWSNRDLDLVGSFGAWVVGDLLLVHGSDERLWNVSRREGVRAAAPINIGGRFLEQGRTQVVRRDAGMVVIGSQGLTVHGPGGGLVTADAIETPLAFTVASIGFQRAVLIQRPVDDETGRGSGMFLVDAPTGRTQDIARLAIPDGVQRGPVTLALADGVAVVGFGEISFVVRTESRN